MAVRAKKKVKRNRGWQFQVLLIMGVICAILFLPTTIMLFLAMLPTIVAAVIDRTGRGTKAMTVGAMNLAGTMPFVIDLWLRENDFAHALQIITDPRTIIVIYSAAGVGYMIDWALSGIVSNMMLRKMERRKKEIEEEQQALIQRWGREVTGEIALDVHGFPVEDGDAEGAELPDLSAPDLKPEKA